MAGATKPKTLRCRAWRMPSRQTWTRMMGPVISRACDRHSRPSRWIFLSDRFLGSMSDLWIGDVGIRVTNLQKSIEFYTKVFDLEEINRGGDDEGKYVLFRDRRSGQRVELNWCAERSPLWTPYLPGEALDHFEVRVKSVLDTLERLRSLGIGPATKKLWVNRKTVAKLK